MRTDAERVANHYNTTLEMATHLLSLYHVEQLVPSRGAGLIGQDINEGKHIFQESGFWWFALGLTLSLIISSSVR